MQTATFHCRGVLLGIMSAHAIFAAAPAQATTPRAMPVYDPRLVQMQPCAPDGQDSLYRVARELLNQGHYRNASQLFMQISAQYPKASCAPEALYWQAFSLYRSGTLEELQQARAALEAQRAQYPKAYRGDARSLNQRIAGELARKGDKSAKRAVVEGAAVSKVNCDREEMAVRVEALNALTQYDLKQARPMIERILARRDECSLSLRRQVVFMLGGQQDEQAAKLLAQVVRSEPDVGIRNDAILFLTRMPTDDTALLSDVLKNSKDPNVQQTVLRALAVNKSPKALAAIRVALKEYSFPPEVVDYTVSQILVDDDSPEHAAFLREMYPKLKNQQLKSTMVQILAGMGGSANQTWLIGLVRDSKEPVYWRTQTLQQVISNPDAKVSELVKLYDKVPDRELRHQLINFYAISDDNAATEKLMSIARAETDPQLLRYTIAALSGRNDPRTQKLLMEILERK